MSDARASAPGDPEIPPARRSCLAVPVSSPRMVAKAPHVGADELVLDLEDAVSPSRKDAARERVVELLAADDLALVRVSVRVNAPRTRWSHLDISALAACPARPASIVVPKVEGPEDLAFVDRLLDGVELASGHAQPLPVQALIETPRGLTNATGIASASPRLDALIVGYADLAAAIGRSATGARDLDVWRPAQEAVLLAARAHGLQAIDGPHLSVAPDRAFTAAAERAHDAGFDGKWAIHPSQIAPLNEIFTPDAAELDLARRIVDALDEGESAERGAVALDGEMVDQPVRASALRTLARARAATGRP